MDAIISICPSPIPHKLGAPSFWYVAQSHSAVLQNEDVLPHGQLFLHSSWSWETDLFLHEQCRWAPSWFTSARLLYFPMYTLSLRGLRFECVNLDMSLELLVTVGKWRRNTSGLFPPRKGFGIWQAAGSRLLSGRAGFSRFAVTNWISCNWEQWEGLAFVKEFGSELITGEELGGRLVGFCHRKRMA